MATILEEYVQKHPGSARRQQEANDMFPGGVTHDNRYVTPFPIYVTHGEGPLKWDVDGNEYVDYVNGHGALILGHSHPAIASAVANQVGRGTHLGANTEEELRWGRAIKNLMPSVEKMRCHSSGTEATLMALRMARAYTGKSKVVKFDEHFHGWHDYAVSVAGRTVPGVPEVTSSSMVVIPPDLGAVEKVLSQDDDIAAVILEPTGAHYGQLPLNLPEFLSDLRRITRSYGVLLIMDEVVTGFRIHPGGAQGKYDIDPDLTTMAKIVAGGLPGGVVGGRADIIDMIAFKDDPDWNAQSRIAHPGTFNANPLSAVAGATCLEMIANEPINQRADEAAAALKEGLNDTFTRMEVTGHAYGISSLVHMTLEDRDVSHPQVKSAGAPAKTIALKRGFINEGIDLMGRGSFIVSSTHTEKEVGRTLEAFESVLTKMRAEGIV